MADKPAPRYQQLAAELRGQISDGTYPVGSYLPTELDLCDQWKVSRFTAREALRVLRESGLVARRRGVGTMVIATSETPAYEQNFDSLDDLLQYARTAQLIISSYGTHTATADQASHFCLTEGNSYVEIKGKRQASGDAAAQGLATIYIREEFAPIQKEAIHLGGAFTPDIERRTGLRIIRIEQRLFARSLTGEEAKLLSVESDTPALIIQRHYFDDRDRLILVSETAHPSSRFIYHQTIMRTKD